ncbi:putative polyvalent protein kinase domain-containing protein [Mucilaginibacter ginsenosidivorans]|uniref:Uncharacterized protein n=1 Tax=Mucilaginibacter ginsenosidivorans TaxID=398053 RepID=A0A5B8UWY0_9SPHI|nr:hypothetical protein [Mucilaginibacter ginsenosidivorans]QEC63185.1 hypothetical protein FRZ54_11550 [Mucilaginibacter ginsenosidivorans]
MKNIKDELQNIILGDEQTGRDSQLKKIQGFLRGYAETSVVFEKQQRFKNEETAALIGFATAENLFYNHLILSKNFISEGAEQKVYKLDDTHVLKTNQSIFYESWLDYFNSLLIHNFFFPATAYSLLGFQIINDHLHAVVKQQFIVSNETTDLEAVKEFLEYNGFQHKRYNDYFNPEMGLIFEDLHDENVLSYNGVLYFIDTVFYLTSAFYAM